eukprot:Gb_21509 [translate_table: standard]
MLLLRSAAMANPKATRLSIITRSNTNVDALPSAIAATPLDQLCTLSITRNPNFSSPYSSKCIDGCGHSPHNLPYFGFLCVPPVLNVTLYKCLLHFTTHFTSITLGFLTGGGIVDRAITSTPNNFTFLSDKGYGSPHG